jgi:hypothetical protein
MEAGKAENNLEGRRTRKMRIGDFEMIWALFGKEAVL